MANKFFTDIQMGVGTSIINLVADPRASAPSSPAEGRVYFNTTDNILYVYNGATWDAIGTGTGDITEVNTPSGSALSGGATSGPVTLQVVVDNSTIEISTNSIRIKDSGVTFAKLAAAAYTDSITGSSSTKLTTENAVVTYVGSAIAAIGTFIGGFDASTSTDFPVAPGGTNKGDYWRVANSGANPSTVHGEILKTGDVVIAATDAPNITTTTDWIFLQMNIDQATETVPGIAELATQAETNAGTDDTKIVTPLKLDTLLDARIVAASETAAGIAELATQAETNAGTDDTRIVTPLKLDTLLDARIVAATETAAGIAEIATQVETDAGTDDTRIVTPLKLATFFDAVVGGYAANVGNGTNLSFVVTHSLNTLDVVIQLFENSTGDTVYTDVARTTVNTVTVTFATAPTTNQFRIVIKK
jgi:hypothetical protein